MSEKTTCNYCLLQNYRKLAKDTNSKLTIIPAIFTGVDIYIHPKSISIRKLSLHKRKVYFECWFMKLSDKCAC